MKHLFKYIPLIALVCLVFGGTSAHADEERPLFSDNSVIAVMKPKTSGVGLMSVSGGTDIFASLGISEVKNLDVLPARGISLFSVDYRPQTMELTLSEAGEDNVLKAVEALNGMEGVEYAQPNYCYYLDDTPNDPSYSSQYGLIRTKAPALWDLDIDCSGTVVAVLDSGINLSHEDLIDNLWVNTKEFYGTPGVDDDNNGYVDDINGWNFVEGNNTPNDNRGHGTHVAGIVSARTNNGKGIASIARNAKIMPLKLFDPDKETTTSHLYSAMRYVRDNNVISVANCSWGGNGTDTTLYKLLKQCSNTVFTCSAGNTAADNDSTGIYPASYQLNNIISVGATDSYDKLADFSNYGAVSVDIAAPGSYIYSTYIGGSSEYINNSGTSMAAPFVASAAAVMKSINPNKSAEDIVWYILDGADEVLMLDDKINSSRRLNVYKSALLVPTIVPTATPTPTPTPTPSPTPVPTQTPVPTEIPVPEVKQAALTEKDGIMHLVIEFSYGAEPDIGHIKAYAAYKSDGILKNIEALQISDKYTADFSVSEEYADCDLCVYLWTSSLKPLCKPVTISKEGDN